MPKQKVNGIEMYYEMHGQGDSLVLIMGLRRNVEWWYRQIPTLSKHFEVLVFDNRGAGRTDKPKMDYSIRLFADDTDGLMEALGIRKANILGVSMGGYIAQELALNYPDRVKRLVLACTGPGGERAVLASPERLKKFTANEGLTPEEILRKDMDIYFSDEYLKRNHEKMEGFIKLSLRYYQPPDAFERQFAACLGHDTVNRLSRIGAPTLILTGDDDPLVPPENSKILNELIPGSKLVFSPGKRHCFFMEEADRFNQMVIDFFESKS
jgi:pimeloyl-ACP methyl ester carboxylesterase